MPWYKSKRTLATVDLAAYLDEEDEDYDRQQYFKKASNLRADIRQYGAYLDLRNNYGLTKKQAELGANFQMAGTKRKSTSSSKSNTKKARTTKKYGGTGKKNADKYGSKGVDWDTVKKLADAAAKKEIGKNIETQYSQTMITMTHDSAVERGTIGWDLQGLNYDAAAQNFRPDLAMIFNLGYLSQPGSSLMPGYRVGQRINAKYLKLTLTGNLPQMTADCTYHMRIVRRKNDQSGQQAFAKPTLIAMPEIGLFKSNTDGPLASQSSYGLFGHDHSPYPFFSSAGRQNTEAWTFCKGGHVTKYVKAQAMDTDENDDKYVASFCEQMYFPLEEEWEFVSRNGSDIKGGNYFVVVWREGGPDFVQYTNKPNVIQALGLIQVKLGIELAFKDG